ncbi:MAG TPA: ATP-binding protein [Egibacteraceae bacterium]|nr:ATP-binding protein [Egibacteraceae bacterium]
MTVGLWLRRILGLAAAARVSAAPFPHFAADYAFVSLLALLIVFAYIDVGRWAIALLAIPLWLGFNTLRSAREAEDRAEQLAETVRELETLNALATELLTVRTIDQSVATGRGALLTALATNDIDLSLTGDLQEHLRAVKVPGAAPVALGVPADSSDDVLRVAEGIAGLLGMALQRLNLEQELADVQEARIALTGQILEEGTRERSRIALEIHDEVLPYFAAAEIQADNVSSALGAALPDRAIEIAGRTRDAVHGGIKQLREVLEALRRQVVVPGGLRDGLAAALEELRVERNVEVVLDVPDPLPPLPLALEILILETVRGCLTNIARHAEADQVQVRLEVAETVIAVEICDNGRGFDPAAVPAGHHGLALMAQRVSLARGKFEVASVSGQGTKVLVEVPA